MAGDHPERDEHDESAGTAEETDVMAASGGEPIGDPPETDRSREVAAVSSEEPSAEPPAEEPPEKEPPVEEPPVEELPVEEPPVEEPPLEEPDDAPVSDAPEQALSRADANERDEGTPEARSSEEGAPFSEEIDLPPPTSVPVPPPYTPPRVVPPAQVIEVSPAEGSILGETRVTLSGEHLYRESIVRIDGEIARTIGATEPRELRIITPPRKSAGVVDLSIQNPNSEVVVVEGAFRYLPLPPPKIVSVAPDHVSAGRKGEITILGEGFVKSTIVLLDGIEAAVKLVDATTLDVTTPGGKHGKAVDVAVKNPDGKQDVARRAFVYDERFD